MDITNGLQIKVARVAAGLTHKQLADQSKLAISTIRRIEVEKNCLKSKLVTLNKITEALKEHGVSFRVENGKLVWEKDFLDMS